MEKRVQLYGSEVRASKSGNKMRVTGIAARYGVLSHPLPAGNSGKTFRERIAKRAFDGVLADPKLDCILSVNHDNDKVLGRTTSGTLRLRGTDQGLAFDCDLPDTQVGRDTYELVKRGDLNQCSFQFELGERSDEWSEEEEIEDEKDLGLRGRVAKAVKKIAVRTIKSFRKLHDVSICTFAAYPGTSVDSRNLVAAECRSHVERISTPTRTFHAPGFSRAIRELKAFNQEHGGSFSLGEMYDAADRRKRMLRDILD
jgi:HK97 family phage prohead protease